MQSFIPLVFLVVSAAWKLLLWWMARLVALWDPSSQLAVDLGKNQGMAQIIAELFYLSFISN